VKEKIMGAQILTLNFSKWRIFSSKFSVFGRKLVYKLKCREEAEAPVMTS